MDSQPSTRSFPNERAKAAHAKLLASQVLLQQTQYMAQPVRINLQNTTRHHDQITEKYSQTLAHVDLLQQQVNQGKLRIEHYEEMLPQQANNYKAAGLTYSAQRQEICLCDDCYEKNKTNRERFVAQKEQFMAICQQLQKSKDDYQQVLAQQQQATHALPSLKKELDDLQRLKENQTAQHNNYAAVLTMLQENVQAAQAQYENSLITPLLPHPNYPPRSYSVCSSSSSSAESVISDASTHLTLSMGHQTDTDTHTELSYASLSPPSSPIAHGMSGCKTPSPVKRSDLLDCSPSKFFVIDNPN